MTALPPIQTLSPITTGERLHDPLVALVRQQGVVYGVDSHVGADVDVAADRHGSLVEDREVEVPDEVVPHGDLRPEVAVERAVEAGRLAGVAEEFPDDRLALFAAGGRQLVEAEAEFLGAEQGGADFGRHGVEPAPRAHLFEVVHVIDFR